MQKKYLDFLACKKQEARGKKQEKEKNADYNAVKYLDFLVSIILNPASCMQ